MPYAGIRSKSKAAFMMAKNYLPVGALLAVGLLSSTASFAEPIQSVEPVGQSSVTMDAGTPALQGPMRLG